MYYYLSNKNVKLAEFFKELLKNVRNVINNTVQQNKVNLTYQHVWRWIIIDFCSLNPNQGSKMSKKIQQGRQRRFTEFSSARGAIPNSAEHNGGRVIFIFDNGRRHYYSDVKKEIRKNIENWACYRLRAFCGHKLRHNSKVQHHFLSCFPICFFI